MRRRLTVEHCKHILSKYGIVPVSEDSEQMYIQMLREVFMIGIHLDTMKSEWRKPKGG